MKWAKDKEGDLYPELSTNEVRQARFGKPVLYVLISGSVGVIIGFLIAGFVIG